MKERRFELVQAMTFPELLAYIDKLAALEGEFRPLLVIEDSDSSTNWHLNKVKASGLSLDRKLRTAAAIGRSAGMCHAVIRLLNEYAQARADVRSLPRARRGEVQTGISQVEAVQFLNGYPADAIKSNTHFWRSALQICLFG